MRRFKVVYAFDCSQGHGNFAEMRFESESLESATKYVNNELRPNTQCNFCTEYLSVPGSIQFVGVEEIPEHPAMACLGYICACGERVAVYRFEANTNVAPPVKVTASCSKGHKRVITSQMIPTLDQHWIEEVN